MKNNYFSYIIKSKNIIKLNYYYYDNRIVIDDVIVTNIDNTHPDMTGLVK